MARINGHRTVNGLVNGNTNLPPPSSILATHFAPVQGNASTNDLPDLNTHSFELLLAECLGYNENGKPNLGTDVNTNHKLISVLFKAGLDRAIDQPENPFHARQPEKDRLLFLACLDVLKLCLERTPNVLYVPTLSNSGNQTPELPLYFWLLPKLLALLAPGGEVRQILDDRIQEVLVTLLQAETSCSKAGFGCFAISDFVSSCTEALLNDLAIDDDIALVDRVVSLSHDQSAFAKSLSRLNLEDSEDLSVFQSTKIACALSTTLKIIRCRVVAFSNDFNGSVPNRQHVVSQVLEQLDCVWRLLVDSLDESEINIASPLADFFGVLQNLGPVASGVSMVSCSRRYVFLWATSVSDCVDHVYDLLDPSHREALEIMLTSTSRAVRSDGRICVALSEMLGSRLQIVIQEGQLDNELQRLVSDIITVLQTPNLEVRGIHWGDHRESSDDEFPDGGRSRKRLRVSIDEQAQPTQTAQQMISKILTSKLTGIATPDLLGLRQLVSPHFSKLNEADQCASLTLLGSAACAFSSMNAEMLNQSNSVDTSCAVCNNDHADPETFSKLSTDVEEELLNTLLTVAWTLSKSVLARTVALSSLGRILKHSTSLSTLSIQEPAAKWMFRSLQSSYRDIRILATQNLEPFISRQQHLETSFLHQNRVEVFDFLQSLWISGKVHLQETAVIALTNIGDYVGDEERNIILVRLVEYLGSGNQYINGLVYSELQRMAHNLQLTVAAMLRPFWRTIGTLVIKHLQDRPFMSQQLSDLLGMDVDGLLMLIEEFALPHLVLAGKKDVIQRMASLHGSSTSPFNLCSQKKHLAPILAHLLIQSFPDPDEGIMSILRHISPDFDDQDLSGWISLEPIQIACELLKAVVDAGDGHATRPQQALRLLAKFRLPLPSSGSRRGESIGVFLEHNALAIITQFTGVLNEVEAVQPNLEKRRCLSAIGQLAKLGKSRIAAALPQICACLRSALEHDQLCDTAFASWALILNNLNEEDVEGLLDQTLAIIIHSWDLFDSSTRILAYNLVSSLLKEHTELIRRIFKTMPSLSAIPIMAKFEAEIGSLKRQMDERHQFIAFVKRLSNENITVVERALEELVALLREKNDFVSQSVLREQPDVFVTDLTRALLDVSIKFNFSTTVMLHCGQCLGWIGCLDVNKMETVREKKSMVVLSDFNAADETVEFVLFFLEQVIVPAFLSASTSKAQGFLAWAIQQLLKICDIDTTVTLRSRTTDSTAKSQRWQDLPEEVRNTMTPFLNSKYTLHKAHVPEKCSFPLFKAGSMDFPTWLRAITLDFMYRNASRNAAIIFEICQRIINDQVIGIASFILPFASLNVLQNGTDIEKDQLHSEILSILQQPMEGDHATQESIRQCSESIFEVLDYMTSWLHKKRKGPLATSRGDRGGSNYISQHSSDATRAVEELLASIPANVISQRAIECRSYARALLHWEQHIRTAKSGQEDNGSLERLQEIYAQIDEPDGIEGIASQLQVLDIDQQILEHRKAGRWTAAQSWYELQLNTAPDDPEIQISLLQCLKESGQHEVLLHHFEGLDKRLSLQLVLPYAMESAWTSGRWDKLEEYVNASTAHASNFDFSVAKILLSIRDQDMSGAQTRLDEVYQTVASSFSLKSIGSLQAAHDSLLKLHVLTDLHRISESTPEDKAQVLEGLKGRLDILGSSSVGDKQYLLGVRRAAMQLVPAYNDEDIAASWLASARLARKAHSITEAFNAILHAATLDEKSATIEQAKLMWKEEHQRKAIRTLEGVIEAKAFAAHDSIPEGTFASLSKEQKQEHNLVAAKAHALLGKWLDAAGQTQSEEIAKTLRKATNYHKRWEKSWYLLGKHYNRVLDSERSKPLGKQSQVYLTGEVYKMVIDNYLRSLVVGNKYVFQTLPKVLTLWLELVSDGELSRDSRRGNDSFHNHNAAGRKKVVDLANEQMKKYADRMSTFLLYTILPQVVARICNPNPTVYTVLTVMVVRVVQAYPQQALWTLLAMLRSKSSDRAARGVTLVNKVQEGQKKSGKSSGASELRTLINAGQRLAQELIRVSDFEIRGKPTQVMLGADLGFDHKITPSKLVVPVEACLIPTLPTNLSGNVKAFRAFPKDPVTIDKIMDEAMVLSSLQKPRRLTIRGSDGNLYRVLAKPKDDLRKDQRLMEFNAMINRFLKRDMEASKRRLYIRTYAVVPLNESCGLIEWVDGLKTFRDILLALYKEKRISPDYNSIKHKLDEACKNQPETTHIFKDEVLRLFPPVFHEWFVETFPDPSNWFNARLRYTRSAAVMSIAGHVLGLGDRHGENILFEETNGGTLHVDFNCLFDKGLTFEKPERVPFRLTPNMVDAFGAYGYEGPFRKCSEITLTLLRSNEDALMTILETFLHDPTTDFMTAQGQQKATKKANTPDSPQAVLDAVRAKVKGMLPLEPMPLSVGGYVEELIKQATDHANLSKMYIGWCAFF